MEYSSLDKMEFKITDYLDFIEILQYIFRQDPRNEGIRFTMSRPKGTDSKDVQMPSIVYSLVNKQPGLVGDGVREIKPRFRQSAYEASNYTNDSVHVQYRNQLIDAEIDFTIYASNNEDVYRWTSQLRKFIQEQMGIFQQMGISRLIWLSEEDNSERIDKDYYISRKLTYLFSYEEITRIEPTTLHKLNVFMDIIAQNKTDPRLPGIYFDIDYGNQNKTEPRPPAGTPEPTVSHHTVSHSIRYVLHDLMKKLETGTYTLRETTEEDESYPDNKYIIVDDKGLSIDIDTFLAHDIEMSLWKENNKEE